MIDQLRDLCASTSPKQLGRSIKKDQQLAQWLLDQTENFIGNVSLSERAYAVLNDIKTNQCDTSKNAFRFKSFDAGYGFCGMANVCECARNSVSSKVKESKNTISHHEQLEINAKRAATNLAKYGVANAGQTVAAITKHKEFYSDTNLVKQQVDQQKQTMIDKYGVENAAQLDSVKVKKKSTNLARYGVENPMQSTNISNKSVSTRKTLYTDHYLAKKNYEKFQQMIRENFSLEPLISREDYIGVQSRPNIKFQCLQCNNIFEKRFDYANLPICKICHPTDITYKSKQELELLTFIKSVYPDLIISGDRTVINPYEIDIYIPKLDIGIEYCGLYWHSELSGNKSWNYHYRKWEAAKNKGIKLFTIFEDEWLQKNNIIKELLKTKLGCGSKTTVARKCYVTEIGREPAYNFYDKYHILGSPKRLPISFGIFYDSELIGCMSFINEKNSYVMTRFTTKGFIPGAAGKLLSNFIKIYQPSTITTFSDNRYSDGGLYKKLGFTSIGTVPPMQQYVENYIKRHDKRSLNKNSVIDLYSLKDIDKSITEWDLLKSLSFDRIWDCGKIKWQLNLG